MQQKEHTVRGSTRRSLVVTEVQSPTDFQQINCFTSVSPTDFHLIDMVKVRLRLLNTYNTLKNCM